MEVVQVISDAHEQPVTCVALNKFRRELYSGAQDGLIRVWDVETGRQMRVQAGHKGWVTDMLFNAYTKLLFSSGVDGVLFVWNDKGKEIQEVDLGEPLYCLAWNQKRKQLVAGGNGLIHVFKVARRAETLDLDRGFGSSQADIRADGKDATKVLRHEMTVKGHTDHVRGLCCSESGKLFSAGYDKSICVYDSVLDTERPREPEVLKDNCHKRSREPDHKFENCHGGAICSLAFDFDHNWLITGSYDGCVKIWSQEGRCLDVFEGLCDTVTGLCYVPATKNYWITGKNRKLLAYDPRTPTNITSYIEETSQFDNFDIKKLHQASGTDIVVGITTSRQLVIWKHNPFAAHRVLRGHQDWVEAIIAVTRKEDLGVPHVFSAGSDGLLLHWQPNSELNTDLYSCQEEMCGHAGSILCISYSAENDMLITGSEDCSIRLWPLSQVHENEGEDEHRNILTGHEGRVTGLACCSDSVLASVSHDRSIRYWDLHTKQELECISESHDSVLLGIEFASTHDELATVAAEPVVKVWCAFKRKQKYALIGHTAEVTQVKWCNFKCCWITASDDETICTWSSEGEQLTTIQYQGETVTSMLVDESEEALLVATLDRVIRRYAIKDHGLDVVQNYIGHTDTIRGICQVKEKAQYLSASWDKSIRVWNQDLGREGHPSPTMTELPTSKQDQDESFHSAYEQQNPLIQPKALRANTMPAFRIVTKASVGPRVRAEPDNDKQEQASRQDAQTTLGRRLTELETKLALQVTGASEVPCRQAGKKPSGAKIKMK